MTNEELVKEAIFLSGSILATSENMLASNSTRKVRIEALALNKVLKQIK